MAPVGLDVLFGISVLITLCAGDTCYFEGKNILDIKSKKCEHGCCGYYYDRTCCPKLSLGAIIGIAVAGVVVIVVVAIVALCYFKKKGGSQGTVVAAGQQPAPGVAVVSAPQTVQYQTGYYQNPQQQPYPQPGYVYPPTTTAVAYPPTTTNTTVVTTSSQQQDVVT